ncbi:MAG: hypothetical protein JWM53_4948 [bacterium]|nr:hypothetical protein [bacterium]
MLARLADPLRVRWIVLRGLGLVYLSVFASLAGQIHGLVGPHGILPATDYLASLRAELTAPGRLWLAPTLLWLSASDGALTALVVVGLAASLALFANLWPRASLAVAALAFLSFVAVGQAFAYYQSDGMLLEASLFGLFYAPRGLRPGLGAASPPSRASLWLLRWEWFRIYFESGLVKLWSGESQWRDLTAMVKYYENGPLPTWLAWYAQQRLPRGFHVGAALTTLAMELVLPFCVLLPRRWRARAFVLFSVFQLGIIATGNYAFLNYLVLLLGFTIVCDLPPPKTPPWRERLGWVGFAAYAMVTTLGFLGAGALRWPARLLAPFRVGENYGLFAVMTRARYELEFQGTRDGKTWVAYPFRRKPQDPFVAPGIYAPYQPRFDWDLWFAALDDVSEWPWVVTVEEKLLAGEPSVLALFARDPFGGERPAAVRAVEWQYWFTTPAEKRATGAWWRRREIGEYAPAVP